MNIRNCYDLNVDFINIETGNIYCIADYKKAKMNGFPTEGCIIKDPSGKKIGIVPEELMLKIIPLKDIR